MDVVSLNLLIPKSAKQEEDSFYVTGDVPELGMWREKRPMLKLIQKSISPEHKENI